MARPVEKDGIRRRGGALFGELRKLELMHETGVLSDEAYRGARSRLMRSVSDADLADDAPERRVAAAPIGVGALLTVGGAALAAVAMLGATPEALAWISLAGLATAALAVCWEA